MDKDKHKAFSSELETIQSEDIRNFAMYLLDNAPDYFYTMPASTTGKYHPSYALGEGGLLRHTRALVGIMNHLLALEQYQELFTEKQRDLLRVAGLIHDIKKKGNDESKFTVHEHPLVASEWLMEKWTDYTNQGNLSIPLNAVRFIQHTVEAHMGEWNINKRSSIVLPKPETEEQKFLHICDYLASRKNLEYIFSDNNEDKPFVPYTEMATCLEEYRMPFGKYKNVFIMDVAKTDMSYLRWLSNQSGLDTTLKHYLIEAINKS